VTELLFIDSEPVDDTIIKACSDRGLGFRQLADGNEALAYAKENRPSIMVLNVELPKVSGYTVCNKVKKDNRLRAVPLILTSSQATIDIFEQHKKLKTRAEEYLLKPYSSDDLLARIDLLMQEEGQEAAPADMGAAHNSTDEVVALDGASGASPFSMPPMPTGDVSGEMDPGPEMDAILDAASDAVDAWGEPGVDEIQEASADMVLEESGSTDSGTSNGAEKPAVEVQQEVLSAEDKKAVRGVRKENIQLKARVSELEARLSIAENLKERLDKASDQARQSRAELAKKEQEVLEFQDLLDQQEDQMESLRQGLVERDSSIASIRAVAEGAELDTEEAQTRVEELEKHEQELEAREKELSEQLGSLTTQVAALDEQMESTTKEYESQKDKLLKVKDAIAQALSDLE
jgi:CheY-like chemotaxis protein